MAGVCGGVFLLAFAASPAFSDPQVYVNADGTPTTDLAAARASWQADAEFNGNWGLKAIQADGAYALGYTGLGSRIGVIDQPVWGPHPEFTKTIDGEPKVTFITTTGIRTYDDPYLPVHAGDPFTFDGSIYVDGYGEVATHGTHVAGIAAANRDTTANFTGVMQGVAYNARIFAADNGDPGPEDGIVLGNDGGTYLAAWQAMIDSDVDVITNSWGIGISGSTWRYSQAAAQYQEIEAILGTPQGGAYDGVLAAARSGIVIEFSAGNDYGADPDAMAGLAAFIPELEKNWVATMSVEQDAESPEGVTKSDFSSICGYAKYFCVAAPGSDINSSVVEADLTGKEKGDILTDLTPGYDEFSGTSMAGPYVSGSIAVLKERFPYLSNGDLNDILKTTSTDLGEAGVDEVYGWGLINLDKAMGGPGQLISRMDVNLAAGMQDTWSNDISGAALDQRKGEERAEVAGWDARKAELEASIQSVPEEVEPSAQVIAGMEQARALLQAAIDLNYTDTYVPEEFDAAIAALEADPVGQGLLAAYEAAHPNWIAFYSFRGDYEDFVGDQTDTELAVTVVNLERDEIIAANDAVNVEIDMTQDRVDQLAQKTDADYLGSLVKGGDGTLRLTGDSTYKGDTLVNDGLLAVDGSLVSTVTINDGGRLGGSGRVGALIAKAGGWVSPGNSIGTLSVSGDASFAKGSGLLVEVDGAGNSDRLAVDGKATLLGGVVMVVPDAPTLTQALLDNLVGKTYTILTAGGGVAGTFEDARSYYTFLGTDLSYQAGSALLTLDRIAFAEAGNSFNQKQTAGGIESLGAGNPLYDAVLASTIDDDIAATFQALSGDIHASLKGVLAEDSRFLRDAANARVRGTLGGIVTTTAATDASNGGIDAAGWAQAYGSWADIDGDGNAVGLDRNIGGFVTGLDGFVANDWRLGFLVGYANTSLDGGGSSADIDSYQIGVYGGTRRDAIGLSVGAAYARHDIDTTRAPAGASANYDADSVQAFGEAGYTFDTAFAAIEPFAGMAYTHVETDDFTETGGLNPLSGTGSSTDVTTTTLGLRASRQLSLGGTMPVTASGMIGWRHAFGDITPEASLAFAGGDVFVNKGLPIAEDALAIEAGFAVDFARNASLGISYSGQFGDGLTDNAAKATLSVKF